MAQTDIPSIITRGVNDPRDLFNAFDVYQATRLKAIMGDQRLNVQQFTEAFFKAVNSVALYRQRAAVEHTLDTLFRIMDTDGDRRIGFDDLPMTAALVGDEVELSGNSVAGVFTGEEKEVVVYNDLANFILLPVADKTGGDGAQARVVKTPILFSAGQSDVSIAAQRLHCLMVDYLAQIDLTKCGPLQYHAAIERHSLCNGCDVVLFTLNDFATGIANVQILQGKHTSPVLTTQHIPHVKKLVTAGADRALVTWSDADKFHQVDLVRAVSPQTCISYDPLSQILVTGGVDGQICLFPMLPTLGHCLRIIPAHNGWVNGLAFLSDIDAFASCGTDGALKLWDRGPFTERNCKMPQGKLHGSSLTQLRHSKGLRCIFTSAGHGRDVLMWSPFLPNPTETLHGHDKPVVFVHCFHNSPELITADVTGKIVIWDMRKTMPVQTIGGPDSACPVGRITSCSYDTKRNTILIIGDRISAFTPQRGGAQAALLDSPISTVLCCSITRRVFIASGGRILVFELTTGQLLFEHTIGTLDLCLMVLGADTTTLLVGTQEGVVLVLKIGTWHVVQRLNGAGCVRYVVDLGIGHRLGISAPDFSRALAVTATGEVWHFPHGPLCASVNKTSVCLRTGTVGGVSLVGFSLHHGYVYLFTSRTNAITVWDVSVQIQKPSLTIRLDEKRQGAVNTMIIADALDAVLIGTSTGILRVYSATTCACLFSLELTAKSDFIPRAVSFAREQWRIAVMAVDGVMSFDLVAVTKLIAQHQAAANITFAVSRLTVQRRYEADTDDWNRSWKPIMLRCLRRGQHGKHQQQQQGHRQNQQASASGTAGVPDASLNVAPSEQLTTAGLLRSLVVCLPAKPMMAPDTRASADTSPIADRRFLTAKLVERFQRFAEAQKASVEEDEDSGPSSHTASQRASFSSRRSRRPSAANNRPRVTLGERGWQCVAKLRDLYVPSAGDAVVDLPPGPSPVYAIFSRVSRSTSVAGPHGGPDTASGWADYFDTAAEAVETKARGANRSQLLEELRWIIYCAARAVHELSLMKVQTLLDVHRDMVCDFDYFRLVPSQGVWPTDEVVSSDQLVSLDQCMHPPEGWTGAPSELVNMWLLGHFLYRVTCSRSAFNARATKADLDRVFQLAFRRAEEQPSSPRQNATAPATQPETPKVGGESLDHRPVHTTDQLRAAARPCYRENWIYTLIQRLLCTASTRWTAADVMAFLDAPPPEHMSRLKLPARSDLAAESDGLVLSPFKDPLAQHLLSGSIIRSAMNHSIMTCFAVTDHPFLFLTAVFGHSAHVLVLDPEGRNLGVVPAINELRVPWSVDAAEMRAVKEQQSKFISSTEPEQANRDQVGPKFLLGGVPPPGGRDEGDRNVQLALSTLGLGETDMFHSTAAAIAEATARRKEWLRRKSRRAQSGVEDDIDTCCPFYTSILEGRREAGLDDMAGSAAMGVAMPYYMIGWHRAANGKLELLRRGESREMAALETRVVNRRKILRAIQTKNNTELEEQRKVQRKSARAEFGAEALGGDSGENSPSGGSSESEDVLLLPIRGRDLPSDPVLSLRRFDRKQQLPPSPSPQSRRQSRLSAHSPDPLGCTASSLPAIPPRPHSRAQTPAVTPITRKK
jgi:WD40 repeat protein